VGTYAGNGRCVVVLTALNLEYKAVRAHLTGLWRMAHPRGGTGFEVGYLPGAGLPVALVRTGQGNASAGVVAERAIEAFDPAAVVFVGVAGGLKDDIELGDVVVATWVYAVHGAKDEDGRSLVRPRAFEADRELLDLAQHLDVTGAWQADGVAEAAIRVHFAPVASGEVVLNSRDTALARQLHEHYNDAAAVEMESAGVAQAAHLNRGVPMLTVRGISDKADGLKHAADAAGGQPEAAARAALVAVAVLREFAASLPANVVAATATTPPPGGLTDPVSAPLVAGALKQVLNAASGEAGQEALQGLAALVRRARLQPDAVVEFEHAQALVAVLVDAARRDAQFAAELRTWIESAAHLGADRRGSVSNTISEHALITGPVVQTGDVHGSITVR
jgi:adenosylhomocysteine nucleosidase